MQVQCSTSVDPDGNALPGDQQSKRKQSAACICCEKSDKASDQTRAGSQILLGMSDQIYRSKKVLGFWSISSSCQCRQTFGEHRRLAQAAALPAGLRSQFWLGNVSTRSRAKNGIGTDAGDRTIDDMPPALFDNSCGNQITDG